MNDVMIWAGVYTDTDNPEFKYSYMYLTQVPLDEVEAVHEEFEKTLRDDQTVQYTYQIVAPRPKKVRILP